MKKLVFVLFVCLLGVSTYGQNLQTHYDLGKDRKYITTTVEMFRPDKTGSTFFFIDMDYGSNGVTNSPSLAYFEIARSFTLAKSPFAFHVEYNGGLFQSYIKGTKNPEQFAGQRISNAWLTGFDYSINAKDFSKGITLQALYKNIANTPDAKPNNYQFTVVWYYNFAKGKLRFDGFADFWREGHTVSNDGFVSNFQAKKFIFLTEPQLWYNFTNKFAAGSEVEISSNFAGHDGFMVNPTAAVKYTF